MATNEDAQLRILKTIVSEEGNKKWEGTVFAHSGKWKRSTISDVMILQELESVREENKAMKKQVDEMKKEQSELITLVRQMIQKGNQDQEAKEGPNSSTNSTNNGYKPKQASGARDWSGARGSKKPKSGSGPPGSHEYAEAKKGEEAEEKKIKRVRTVLNEAGTDLEKVPYEVPKSRYKPRKIPEPERIRLKAKDEEEKSREVIFCGIPSPPEYKKESPYESAKLVMKACDELKTRYLGNHYGVNVKSTDFAFAQRQIGHINKKFTPITARFRKKEVAEKVLAAAKFINILNKRGITDIGKYREPKETTNDKEEVIKPPPEVVERYNNRPSTFMKYPRTLEQQASDRAARDFRATQAYQDRQKVKEFKREQRISQAHFEAAALEIPDEEDNTEEEHDAEQYGTLPEPPAEGDHESFHSANEAMTPEEMKKAEENKKPEAEATINLKQKISKDKKETSKSQHNKPSK